MATEDTVHADIDRFTPMTREGASFAARATDGESQSLLHLLTSPRVSGGSALFHGNLLVGVGLAKTNSAIRVVTNEEMRGNVGEGELRG